MPRIPTLRRCRGLASAAVLLPLLAATVVLLPSKAAASAPQTGATLRGTVRDARGEPLEDVLVVLVELERTVRSGAAGRFRFTDLPSGRFTLSAVRSGYESAVQEVTVPETGSVTLTLGETAVPIEPLIVTANPGAVSPLRSPLPATVVGGAELDRIRSVSLARTLDGLPGLRNLSTGQEIGKPVIRGLSGSRVRILSAGLPLDDYAWSDEDGPSLDAAAADRLEVVRGPATVLYGPDAVGGVVNVIPAPLPVAEEGERVMRGDVQFVGASNNIETDLVFRGEGASGPWGGRVTVAGRRSEALHTPDGELENTGFAALNGELAVARRGSWGSVTGRYERYGGEFKLLEEDAPPGGEQGGVEEGGPERKLSDDRLQLLGTFPLGDLRFETHVQGQRHHLQELEDDPQAAQQGQMVEVTVFDLLLSTAYGEALLHHSLAPGVTGAVGVSGKLQKSTSDGVIPLIPDATTGSAGLFAVERVSRGPLTLMAGLRGDLHHVDGTDQPQRTFQALTWSVGGVWEAVEGLGFNLNVGTAWRSPTLFELFASGPRLGEARYEIGRSDLKSERSLNVDVGARWELGGVRGEVAAYRNRFDRFLFVQPTDEFRDGYQVFMYEQAQALLWGGEASLEVEPTSNLLLAAQADFVRGTNEDLDEPLPLMPPPRYDLRAEIHGSWPSWVDRSHLGVEGEYVAEPDPDRLNPFDTPVGDHTLLHLEAGFEGELGTRDVALDVHVRNATNTSYRDFLSRYKRFALNPGRDIVIRLRMGL